MNEPTVTPAARLAGGGRLDAERSRQSRRSYAALIALTEDLASARWRNDAHRSGRIRANIDRVSESHLVTQPDREWLRSVITARLDALPDEPEWRGDPFDVRGIEVLERRDLRPSELDVLRMIEEKAKDGSLDDADHRDLAEIVATADGTADGRYARRVFDSIEPSVRGRINRSNERLAGLTEAAGEPLDRGTLDGFTNLAARFLEADAETLDEHIAPNMADDEGNRRNVAAGLARTVIRSTASERYLTIPNAVEAPVFDRLGPPPPAAQDEAMRRGEQRAAALSAQTRSPLDRLSRPTN